MNHLVAYSDESDEDASPRSRKSSDNAAAPLLKQTGISKKEAAKEERRRDSEMWDDSPPSSSSDTDARGDRYKRGASSSFAGPPPPPRRPRFSPSPSPLGGSPAVKSAMKNVGSTVSLVSYGGEDEDDFERADQAAAEDKRRSRDDSEPAPPRRPDDGDEAGDEPPPPARPAEREFDDEASRTGDEGKATDSPPNEDDEKLIDQVVAEGLASLAESNGGEGTPRGDESPAQEEEAIQWPPSPPTPCNPVIERKFQQLFDKKAHGFDMNGAIQERKDFKNPSIYERFIETFEIDEKGTNFAKNVFDPRAFPDNCYYDRIAEVQRKMMERAHAKHAAAAKSSSAKPGVIDIRKK